MKNIKKIVDHKKPIITETSTRKNQLSNNRIKILVGGVVILVGLFLFKNVFINNKTNNFKNKTIPEAIKKILGDPSAKFTIANIKESNGVYQFELTLGEAANARKYTSYITKDGKIIFTSGIVLDTLNQKPTPTPKKTTLNDLKKIETPVLSAFVVSNCPYGLQMQRVFNKAIKEEASLTNYLDVRYLGAIENGKITSMHGDKEAQENLKQICIREEQKDKYWPYVSCYMQADKSDECNATAGIDNSSLQACVTDANRGLAYAKKDFDEANKYQIGSSPTLLLNGQQTVNESDFGGRVADSIKTIVCGGSTSQLSFCSKTLSKDEIASSFSLTDAPATSGSATSAQCATQ